MQKEFKDGKWRRPQMDIPTIVSKLEDVREEFYRSQTLEEVKAALSNLTEMILQSLSHKQEFEKQLQDLLDIMKGPQFQKMQQQLQPIVNAMMEQMQQQGLDEFDEALEELDKMTDNRPMFSMQLDVDTEGLDLPTQSGSPPIAATGNLGMSGHSEKGYDPRTEEDQSQWDDQVADDLIKEFLGVE